MVRHALKLVCLGFMTMLLASCGQTYELQSITVSPDVGYALEGVGKSGQLTVTAHYSNTKTQDVTIKSTYEVGASSNPDAPNGAVTASTIGVVQTSSNVGVCTWHATPVSSSSTTSTTFAYTTDPYVVTIRYSGFTTTAPISVNSIGGCYDLANPAPAGFAGN